MKKDNKYKIMWNTVGSTLNACTSLILLIIVTRINGINDAGIFSYSFATACLFYTLSIYSTRVFQATDLNKKHSDSDYVFNRLITSLIMFAIAFLFCVLRNYDLYKTTILLLLCFFKCIETMEETLYGMLQKNDFLDLVGKSMTFRSISVYLLFLVIDLLTHNLLFTIIFTILFYIIYVICYDLKKLKYIKYNKTSFSKETNLILLREGWNTFLFSFLSIYILNAPRYAIDSYLSANLQTIYGIISMPAMAMSLLTQFIVQPFLVKISEALSEQDISIIRKITRNLIFFMLGLGGVVLLIAYILGIPTLEFLYDLELDEYKLQFMIIMFGALAYGMTILISYILIALRKTFCQVIIVVITACIAFLLSNIFVKSNSLDGAAISYLIIMFTETILYLGVLFFQIKKLDSKKN